MHLRSKSNYPVSIGFGKIVGVRPARKTPVKVIRGQVAGNIPSKGLGLTFSTRRLVAGVVVGGLATLTAGAATGAINFQPIAGAGTPSAELNSSPAFNTGSASTSTTTAPIDLPQTNILIKNVVNSSVPIMIVNNNGTTEFPSEGVRQVNDTVDYLSARGAEVTGVSSLSTASDDYGTDGIGSADESNLSIAKTRELNAKTTLLNDQDLASAGITEENYTSNATEVSFSFDQQNYFQALTTNFGYESTEQVLGIYKYGNRTSLPPSIVDFLDETIEKIKGTLVNVNYSIVKTHEMTISLDREKTLPTQDVTPIVKKGTSSTPDNSSKSSSFNPWILAASAFGTLPFVGRRKKYARGLVDDVVELSGKVLEIDIYTQRYQRTVPLRQKLKNISLGAWGKTIGRDLISKVNKFFSKPNLQFVPKYSATKIYQDLLRNNRILNIERIPCGTETSDIVLDSKLSDKLTSTTIRLAIKAFLKSNPELAQKMNGIIFISGDRTIPENTFFVPGMKTAVIAINPDQRFETTNESPLDQVDNNLEYIQTIRDSIGEMVAQILDEPTTTSQIGKVKRSRTFAIVPQADIDVSAIDGPAPSFLEAIGGGELSRRKSPKILTSDEFPGRELSRTTVPVVARVLTRDL